MKSAFKAFSKSRTRSTLGTHGHPREDRPRHKAHPTQYVAHSSKRVLSSQVKATTTNHCKTCSHQSNLRITGTSKQFNITLAKARTQTLKAVQHYTCEDSSSTLHLRRPKSRWLQSYQNKPGDIVVKIQSISESVPVESQNLKTFGGGPVGCRKKLLKTTCLGHQSRAPKTRRGVQNH